MFIFVLEHLKLNKMKIETILEMLENKSDWKLDENHYSNSTHEITYYKGDKWVHIESDVFLSENVEYNDYKDGHHCEAIRTSSLDFYSTTINYYDGVEEYNVVTEDKTLEKIQGLLSYKIQETL